MSFILILIGLMLALDLVWWWASDRVARRSQRPRLWRSLAAGFALMQFLALLGFLISRIYKGQLDEVLGRFIISAVFLWHFIGLGVFLLLMFGNGIASWFSARRRKRTEAILTPTGEAAVALSRRSFLASSLAVPPALTLAAAGYSIPQQSDFRIRSFELKMPRLPKVLDGLTIAHVSDTHVGGFTRGVMLDKIVDETSKLNADLVLFTGDLINHSLSDLPEATEMLLKIRAREGMFICEGNHDLIENRLAFEKFARIRGLPLLINESEMITVRGQAIQVLGLRWGGPQPRSPRSREHSDVMIAQSVDVLKPQLNPDAFQILLAHHPHAFDPAAALGIPLTLAGHTHGGQLMLTDQFGFGPAMYRYWSGLYEKQESKLLVSNGVGNWFPLRINAPAEILHLTLRASES